MTSEKQIEANRRNALKSTGPKSDDGKAQSRMNALRHGLTAAQAVLPHENEDDYEKLREGMLDSYAPENTAEQAIVEELANAYWRLMRLHRVDTHYWNQIGGSYNRGDEGISEALIQTPDRQMRNFFRYYAQVERSYYKALAAADQIKRERRDRKPLKVIAATAQNGFVSQTPEDTEPAPSQEPSTPAPAAASDPGLPPSNPGLAAPDSGLRPPGSRLAA
jgi:hypothetical protein